MNEILDSMELRDSNPQSYEPAGQGKRLANYLIDIVGYYILSGMIGAIYALYMIQSEGDAFLLTQGKEDSSLLMDYLQGMILILVYYTVSEYYFKGKTLGKSVSKIIFSANMKRIF